MRRREFITLLGGAATVWPLITRAQQSTIPVVGFLCGGSPNAFAKLVDAFQHGLNETGFIEHQNLGIDYRWAEGQYDRLPQLAAELVSRHVAVIATPGGTVETLAAKAATTTIPIVFGTGADPIEMGLVTSLNRPGGNITGVTFLATEAAAKMLELLHEAVPKTKIIGALVNPGNPNAKAHLREIQQGASALRIEPHILNAGSDSEIDAAFEIMVKTGAEALIIEGDPFFQSRIKQLVTLTAQHAIPAVYQNRSFPDAGGLMSYGTSLSDAFRTVGLYTGRILQGEKAADLPVQQAVKVELIINLKTAKALGVGVPLSLLGRADEVIE